MAGSYIAVDWGTTNRRAFLIDDGGTVLDTVRDDRGVLALAPADYPAEVAAVRARLGALPIVAAGMVGSTRGWHDVPYVDAPADLDTLAAALFRVDDADVAIVPGVALSDGTRADVMRGEEVQVLGAVAAGMAPADALFCQPGTHNKWIETKAGRIVDFATVMTGELFAALKAHGTLAPMLDGPVGDGPGFRAGLARGLDGGDVTAALFGVRAGVLLGTLDPAEAPSYASGLLIGADVGSRADLAGRTVHLLAAGPLADLYAAAIGAAGGTAVRLDGTHAAVAGLHHIRKSTL